MSLTPLPSKPSLDRFARTRKLLGEVRFKRLQDKRVIVVGLGAVGGYALEGLARAGVMRLRVVDFDLVQPTNLNRQILALENTIGRGKAEVARERVLAINPECQVEALPLFVGDETMDEILTPTPDLVIDAIDSLNPKTQLLVACHNRQIPVISSMGAALRSDPSKIQTGDLFTTSNCPLAKHLRKRLRRRGIEQGIPCVFSTEKVEFDYQPADEAESVGSSPYWDRGRSRNVLGSLPTVTGIFGLTIANQAIMRLSSEP